jgi:hypothetical protein
MTSNSIKTFRNIPRNEFRTLALAVISDAGVARAGAGITDWLISYYNYYARASLQFAIKFFFDWKTGEILTYQLTQGLPSLRNLLRA